MSRLTHICFTLRFDLFQMFFFGFKDGAIDMSDLNVVFSPATLVVYSMNLMQLGDTLYVLGAQQIDVSKATAEMRLFRFSAQSGEWLRLTPPPAPPRVVSASLIHNGAIYLIGGATYNNDRWIPQNSFQDGCYRYSIAGEGNSMRVRQLPQNNHQSQRESNLDLVYTT